MFLFFKRIAEDVEEMGKKSGGHCGWPLQSATVTTYMIQPAVLCYRKPPAVICRAGEPAALFFQENLSMKKLLLVTAFLLFPTIVLAAKDYNVTLESPALIGGTELKSGTYSIRIDGTNAIFNGGHTKGVTVPVKVEDGAKKYDYTTLEHSTKDGKEVITAIHVGGSKITLQFEK
jgi:hypothetical protein